MSPTTLLPGAAEVPDEPTRDDAVAEPMTWAERPVRQPVVLNEHFFAEAGPAEGLMETEAKVVTEPPCRAERPSGLHPAAPGARGRVPDDQKWQFIERTADGWARTWRVIVLSWAVAAAAAVVLFAAAKAISPTGWSMMALAMAKLADQMTRRRPAAGA